MTDVECDLEQRFRVCDDRVRDIEDAEAALVYGVETSLLQVLGYSEGRWT